MIDLLPLNVWADALSQIAVLLGFLIVGLLFYGALADQAIFENGGRVRVQALGPVDLWIAGILAGVFVLLSVLGWHDANASAAKEAELPNAATMIAQLIAGSFVFIAIMTGIIASLSLRRINWWEALGLGWIQPGTVLARAVVLLMCAFPLIWVTAIIAQVLLAAGGSDDDSQQEIVRFLAQSPSGLAKGVVAVSAILLAPLQEEFIFRGYIYGVIRRYAGVPAGILINAAIFAGIHQHAPSFGGLFVLAVCLTLAYEWSGSLFVPMTVHALFNSLSVVNLLAGGNGG